MNIHDDTNDNESQPERSTSRDLDAIAVRMAAGRHATGEATDGTPGDAAPDGARARDAARIRRLMDRAERPDGGRQRGDGLPELSDVTRGFELPSEAERPSDLAAEPVAYATSDVIPDTDGAEPIAPPRRFPPDEETASLQPARAAARARRTGRGIAVAITVVAGLVIGLGAYAGGGEYISALINGRSPRRASLPAAAPSVDATSLTDSARAAADSIADAEQLASFGELPADTIRRAPFGTYRPPATVRRADSSHRADTAAAATARAVTATRDSSGRAAAPKAGSTVATTAPRTATAARADSARRASSTRTPAKRGAFVVQIRATPDRAEADRLAARLRARGAGGVSVTTSTKNGSTLYRVRYGAFPSETEAKDAARRDGHAEAWIVRQ
jgi:cell division septation protein DedD